MKTTYWTSTILLVAFLFISSYSYFFSKSTIEGVKELGFPDFFRIQLGVLKLIAAFVLIIPGVPLYLKEWSYAGVGCFLITAFVAHIAHKDSVVLLLLLVALFCVLIASRYSMYGAMNYN